MQQRTLGRQGLAVGQIGYGSMGTAIGYGPSDDQESIAAIRRAHDLGVTHFDTARMYGWGEGEKLLGTAIAPFRDEITIATKFGIETDTTGAFLPDSRPEHIRKVVDDSLRNLGVDSIDLLYQHLHDPDVPVEEVVGVMQEFVDAGKVKYLGLSNTTPENVRRAHAVHPITALQTEYSIFERGAEAFFPVLEELGIGLVSYSPLARGFLSGVVKPRDQHAADDFRQFIPWWAPENFDANVEITHRLTELAESKGASLSQLALAWLLARKDYIVPIPGSRNPDRVAQNIAAAELDLTADDLARIDQIAPNGGITGPTA
ncbi:aldo/keto reductase [Cellulosimicrobium sp. BIT-GX5]|uniref:Aldo/keto reductase n=1 Tax=Cellulosimicrobium composti TaxID=2672572 RepID=A0A6N7ZKE9_9MICO|nr:aldo/keto reductase [Cellulosimicrobium composti]MTG89886.1 aldo/keto reductase [Cellulosimicrobium composti]